MIQAPATASNQQLLQQQFKVCSSAKEQPQQSNNQNSLFAYNSAPPSSSNQITNGKKSSIAGLKQIVNPQYAAVPSVATRKGSAISNNNSQNSLDHKAMLRMNFSQSSISNNKSSQSLQLHRPQSHHQRSFSNQKNIKQNEVINTALNHVLKPNSSSSEPQLQLNGIAAYIPAGPFVQNNFLNFGASIHINSLQQQNQINYFEQQQQQPGSTPTTGYPSYTVASQQSQNTSNQNKTSLNMKRPKCLNNGTNNLSNTPKHTPSTTPNHAGSMPNSSLERVKENIDKKQVIQSATHSSPPPQTIPLPAGINLKIGMNAISNKPINCSSSEHKISGRSGSAIANTLNNHILLSINQSHSIRRKMNNNSQSTTNVNSAINGSSNSIGYSKNSLTNYQSMPGESTSLNATTTFSPMCIGQQQHSINNNYGQMNSNVHGDNYQEDQQEEDTGVSYSQGNSNANVVFDRVIKRKAIKQSTPEGIPEQQQPQQFQYLIQSKSSTISSPTVNSTQMLSKTMSFSGHQNNFYSPNSFSKQSSGSSAGSGLLQNQTVGVIASKLKAKNITGLSSNSQSGINSIPTGNGVTQTYSTYKPMLSPAQASDGFSSGNNPNHNRSQNQKSFQENVIPNRSDKNYLPLTLSVEDQQFSKGASVSSGQNSLEQTTPYNQSKLAQFSESLAEKSNQDTLSPNGSIRLGISQSQKGTLQLVMNKLSQFVLPSSALINPMEHIQEIVQLIRLSTVNTPLESVLGKFEENIEKITAEIKNREKQWMNKLAGKQQELEGLSREVGALVIKLDSVTNNKKNNQKAVDGQTQTSQKKRKEQKNSKNAIIQICDQNGNVQEVDTDKENDMLRDYILDQEKKVNVFKEKEAKMIKLLLAVKKRGIDIDQIYNADVINDESADEIVKTAPPHVKLPFSGKQTKLDPDVFRKIDNDQGYADESIVNESDESSFGFIGKMSDQDESAVIAQKPVKPIKGQKKLVPKQLQQKLKLNLDHLHDKNDNSYGNDDENTDDKENRLFHEHILATLQITQDQLDNLQDQIQKDPNNLSPEQISLIQQIHVLQQQHEKDMIAKQKNNQKGRQNIDANSSDNPVLFSENILPSELKDQLTAITHNSIDEYFGQNNNKDFNLSNIETQGNQPKQYVSPPSNEFKQYFVSKQ